MEMWIDRNPVNQEALWSSRWKTTELQHSVDAMRKGKDPVAGLIQRFIQGNLPGKVIDHGCGFGRVSVLLQENGWDVTGIDFSMEGLRVCREIAPFIEAVCADVRKLPMPDESFDGAVSIGVVEHLPEGPTGALQELRRVLRPGGTALITVPFENPWRRARRRMPGGRDRTRHGYSLVAVDKFGQDTPGFYQYSFRPSEFRSLLMSAGFKVVDQTAHSLNRGLSDLRLGEWIHARLQTAFGRVASDPKAEARSGAGSVPGWKQHLRAIYDESDSTLASRLIKSRLGPVFGHMMAYFVSAA